MHEETGLAPVRLKAPFRGYNPDEVAGFEPAEAAALVAQGFAEAVEPDERTPAEHAAVAGGVQDRMVRSRTPRGE
mgnify:FL=1